MMAFIEVPVALIATLIFAGMAWVLYLAWCESQTMIEVVMPPRWYVSEDLRLDLHDVSLLNIRSDTLATVVLSSGGEVEVKGGIKDLDAAFKAYHGIRG